MNALAWCSLLSMVRASTLFKLLVSSLFILLPWLGDSETRPLQVSPTGLLSSCNALLALCCLSYGIIESPQDAFPSMSARLNSYASFAQSSKCLVMAEDGKPCLPSSTFLFPRVRPFNCFHSLFLIIAKYVRNRVQIPLAGEGRVQSTFEFSHL